MKKTAKKFPAKKSPKVKSAPKKATAKKAAPDKGLAGKHDWPALLAKYKAGASLAEIATKVGLETVHCSSTWRQLVRAAGGPEAWRALMAERAAAAPKKVRPFVKRGKGALRLPSGKSPMMPACRSSPTATSPAPRG